tara:strand:+ start:133 stop:1062 length:930 start_codon:yes stop_codon:yes gene_type:complete
MIKKIKSAVFGLGNIGLGDVNKTNYNKLLTHCASLNENRLYDLKFTVDSNKKRRKICEKYYGVPSFTKISSISYNNKIDLAVISVPTKSHFILTKNVIKKFKPKVILMEKPFCDDLKKAILIKRICKKKNIKLFLNYPRRILKETQILSRLIKNRFTYGKIIFSNGLLNNGCHFIDLCNFLFGNYINIKKNNFLSDYSKSFTIYYSKANIDFAEQSKKKNYFEINLMNKFVNLKWSQKSIFLNNLKIPKMKLKIFYKKKNVIKSSNINIKNYQKNVYFDIANYLRRKKNTLSNLEDGIQVKKIINEVIN